MFTRRSVIALSASLPLARRVPRLDVEDIAIEQLDTGDVLILGISPDAAMLVGFREGGTLCIVDSISLKTTAETEPMPWLTQSVLDANSFSWSPDNSRLAFSLNTWLTMVDSDIYLVDVATGELTNATSDNPDDEAQTILDNPNAIIDMYPVWKNEGELFFARHESVQDDLKVSIQSLNVDTGEMAMTADLGPANVQFVSSPLKMLSDGSLTFTSQPQELDELEIIVLHPDGTTSTVKVDDMPMLMQIDANDTHSLAFDARSMENWLIPYDVSSDPVRFAEAIGYEDKSFFGEPAIASNPETYAGVATSPSHEKFRVLTNIDGDRRDHGYLDGGVHSEQTCHLAKSTLLITTRETAWIVDLSS